jgi:hypothetical protein
MAPAIALPPWLYEIDFVKQAFRWLLDVLLSIPPVGRFLLQLWGIVVILGKPRSRGTVRLASPNPEAPARIDPNYFSDPRDQEALVAGVKLAREMAAGPALAAEEGEPG